MTRTAVEEPDYRLAVRMRVPDTVVGEAAPVAAAPGTAQAAHTGAAVAGTEEASSAVVEVACIAGAFHMEEAAHP